MLTHYPNPSKLPKEFWSEHTKKAVIGFSHGVCGIAYALYKTETHKCSNKHILEWIKKALTYERNSFDIEFQNWPNSFSEQKKVKLSKKSLFQNHWCHGSLGIGLSRLGLKRLGYIDNYINTEIAISILLLKSDHEQLSMNLCHGSLGRLEFLLYLKEEGLIETEYFNKESLKLLEIIINKKNLCTESQEEIFIPGLMTGQAGVIYLILRILYPSSIPSILLIEG